MPGRAEPQSEPACARGGRIGTVSAIGWAIAVALLAVATPAATSSASSKAPAPATSTPEAPSAGEKPARASIPVPEVARQADEVARLLRDFDGLLAPSPAVGAAERRLPEIATRIAAQNQEATHAIDQSAGAATLDGLTAQWQATSSELVGYVDTLARRATVTESAIERLAGLRDTWTRARADAQASRAPAPVIGRIDGVLASIASSETRLRERRGEILLLQDRVARELAQCEAMLARIASARRLAVGSLLHRDSAPLWHAEQRTRLLTNLPGQVGDAVVADRAQLSQFARDQRWTIPVQAALFVVLLLVVRSARRTARDWASRGEVPPTTALVFEHFVSAALLLSVLSSLWLYAPPLPRSAVAVLQVLVLVPAVRIMRFLVDPQLVPALYVLGIFFLADIVRHLAAVVPLLEQQIFLLEMLAAVIVWGRWAWQWRRAANGPGTLRAARLVALAASLIFAVSLVAGISGFMALALLLGAGMLGSGYLAMVFYASVRVADGLVAFALRARPLRHLAMVRHLRPLIERRIHRLVRWFALAAWVAFSLRYFGLWNTAVSATEAALTATLKRGSVSISLGDVLVFGVTVGVAFLLSALIRSFLAEEVYPRLPLGRGLPDALSGVLHYTLLLVGFLLALAAVGIDLTKVTILAGALGVGIGFGLQNVVNNFVSGAIVLVERKINVGDAVQINDVVGQVQQMGMRACTVRTWEGAEVIVPNAALTSEKVVNWTLSDRRRRIDVAVGVAYSTPPEKTLDIMLDVARAHPQVLADPAPVALFRQFGESALVFEMRVWTDRFELGVQTQSELSVALYAALQKAGIEIPFPQREIRVRRDEAGTPREP